MGVRVGCCGWSYTEWVGSFYSNPRNLFEQYSKVFDTVEMDSTFYSIPSRKVSEHLAARAPQGFRFIVKAPKAITHAYPWLSHPDESAAQRFLRSIEPISPITELILLQFPPRFTPLSSGYLLEVLELFSRFKVNTAVEFRHLEWVSPSRLDETKRSLEQFKSSYVVVDEPLLPNDVVVTSQPVYVRLHGHGRPTWYEYSYSEEELRFWAARIDELVENGNEVTVVFNNHPKGNAPKNAIQLARILGLEKPSTPPSQNLDKYL